MSQLSKGKVLLGLILSLALFFSSEIIPKDAALAQEVSGTSMSICDGSIIAECVSDLTMNAGDSFDVNILVGTDIITRGMQVSVIFDPALVQVDNVTEGTFYSDGAAAIGDGAFSFFIPGTIDNVSGSVTDFGIAILGGPVGQGATGSGVALTLTMSAIADGTTALDIIDEANSLISDAGDPPAAIPGTVFNDGEVVVGSVQVVVPDVVGLEQSSAEAAITDAGLVPAVTTANSETVAAGNVIRQDPAGGTSVAPGSSVDLEVSLGSGIAAPRDMKLDAIEILSPHVAASDKFEKAIKKIEESLKPELWAAGNSGGVDPRHLDSMDGKRVFDYERDAVRELMRLLKDGKVSANALGGAELGQDLLVRADWNLAALALSENAGLTAANPADQADVEEELQKAEEELAKGEEERAAGKFDTAIEHFKKSWESTMKAVEIAGVVEVPDPDNEAPVITLLGENPVEVVVGGGYTEFGATAIDNVDGNISGAIDIDASAVDTTMVGTYMVTFNVKDAAGNAADEVSRTVNVVSPAIAAPRDMKLDAIEILSPHVAASDKFEKAIKKIEDSLKPELWAAGNSGGVDPSHLDSMDGKRVFDYERDAVRELMRLLKDGKVGANALGGAELGQDLLVRADWNLAALALSENAGLTAANPADQADVEEELQKAEEELAKGEEERAAGKFDTAIQHYKKSWESTMKAIEIAG